MLPPKLIDGVINSYLERKYVPTERLVSSEVVPTRYFKLPYIGNFSSLTKSKIRKLVTKLCKPIDIKIVFTTSKIK